MYTIAVPANAMNLVVTITGSGDADLYVLKNGTPTTATYTCRSWATGNTETCTINNPTAGTTYYIAVRAYSAFSGVNLKATRTP